MIYKILHKTTYKYEHPVSFGNHVACLTPRTRTHHTCVDHDLHILPEPATRVTRVDYFGNRLDFFTIEEPHEELSVEARSRVTVDGEEVAWPEEGPAWETAAKTIATDLSREGLEAYQYVFESPRVKPGADFASYAAACFPAGRPLTEAVLDLTKRIYREFKFDASATNVRTSPDEVLRRKRGVCQDFAQLQIACLRSLGLAARYVSGYLRTYPPPGKARLIGADASHAWVSVWCPGSGWLDLDPTNNLVPSESHVTLAWGRDYGDVSPLRGVILGGRDHELDVGVDMEPLG